MTFDVTDYRRIEGIPEPERANADTVSFTLEGAGPESVWPLADEWKLAGVRFISRFHRTIHLSIVDGRDDRRILGTAEVDLANGQVDVVSGVRVSKDATGRLTGGELVFALVSETGYSEVARFLIGPDALVGEPRAAPSRWPDWSEATSGLDGETDATIARWSWGGAESVELSGAREFTERFEVEFVSESRDALRDVPLSQWPFPMLFLRFHSPVVH